MSIIIIFVKPDADTSPSAPDNQDIRAKDSIYTAIGLAAPVVHQQLDFDSFITATLVQEVQKDGPGYNILRRRIAILLAQWISVKISEEKRPVVYQIYQHLLDRSSSTNDIVVRITAGREFKNIADEWDFKAGEFMPYCPETLSRIMSLIEEVTLSETKMALLHSISTLVVRLEHHVSLHESFTQIMNSVWLIIHRLFHMLTGLSTFYLHYGNNLERNTS